MLAVTVGGRNIAQVSALPLDQLAHFTQGLELTDGERRIADAVLAEIGERLRFLLDVGLGLIDLGPDGGHRGGEVIAEGTPEQLAAHPRSHTGRFLSGLLKAK